LGFNIGQVKAARNDDNVNILALASDFTLFEDAKLLVETFLTTAYDPTDNHARRIEKIKQIENSNF
jgi:ribose 5-phosphate isomerase RpiB